MAERKREMSLRGSSIEEKFKRSNFGPSVHKPASDLKHDAQKDAVFRTSRRAQSGTSLAVTIEAISSGWNGRNGL